MKKLIFTLFLLGMSLILFAKEKMILYNEVEIINDTLLKIIKEQVIPMINTDNVCIDVYSYKTAPSTYEVCLQLILKDEISKKVWENICGYTLIDDELVIFRNIKRKLSLIRSKKSIIPITVIPFTDYVPSIVDMPFWRYKFNNGNLMLEERILAY
ncbi:MAG: hypothetical protein IJ296_08965 [Bacteroidales bacterium]|nr:hypothetical protein [Bacteroidales bacterium]